MGTERYTNFNIIIIIVTWTENSIAFNNSGHNLYISHVCYHCKIRYKHSGEEVHNTGSFWAKKSQSYSKLNLLIRLDTSFGLLMTTGVDITVVMVTPGDIPPGKPVKWTLYR